MHIVRKKEYRDSLESILTFIARDSVYRARLFQKQLDEKIENLEFFPYKYRRSIHHDDPNVRDLIFKGYTIVYRVNIPKDRIEVVDIFKWTK